MDEYSMDISNLPKKILKAIDTMKKLESNESWKERIYQFIQQNQDDSSDNMDEEEEEWERIA
jgi:hypothetical protein